MSLKRYTIIRELGSGGMGKVFLVRDQKRPGQELALKAVSIFDPDPVFLACFKAEFEILSALEHPHLAKVYDFTNRIDLEESDEQFRGEGSPFNQAQFFYTSEFVPGENLFRATEDLDWRSRLRLFIPLCRALSYIHSRGIIHRDLKPSNILVESVSEGKLKVLDFGLAKSERSSTLLHEGDLEETSSSTLAGTISYMAPEIIRGERMDRQSDLYSLGIVLYRVLTRKSPFHGLSKVQTIHKHLQGVDITPRSFEPDLPRRLDDLIMSMIAPQPEGRPQNAGEILREVADLLGELAPEETKATSLGYVGSGKLIGRNEVMSRVHNRLSPFLEPKDVLDEKFKPIVIQGEAGLGKKRICQEVKRHCQLQGIPFIGVEAYHEDRPLETVVHILQGMVDLFLEIGTPRNLIQDLQGLQVWLDKQKSERILDESLSSLEDIEQNFRDPKGNEFNQAIEILSQYLEQFIPQVPKSVLVLQIPIEHFQGDPDPVVREGHPWLFFNQLHHRMANSPVSKSLLLVYTTGPENLDWISKEEKESLQIENLLALSQKETFDLLVSMLGTQELPKGLLESVYDFAQGNPLHIEEIMRALVSENILRRSKSLWELDERAQKGLEQFSLPKGIEEALARRIQHCNSDQRDLLAMMAIINEPQSIKVNAYDIHKISGWSLPKVLEVMDECVALEWIRPLSKFHYEFITAAGNKAISASLDSEERKGLHAKVVKYFAPQKKVPHFRLAFHHEVAENWLESIEHYLKAGELSQLRYAPKEALRFFEKSALLLKEKETPLKEEERQSKQVFAEEKIARLLSIIGQQKESLEHYQHNLDTLEEQRSKSTFTLEELITIRTRILRRMGHIHRNLGFPEKAIAFYESAVRELGNRAKGWEGALLLVILAGVKSRMGLRAQARVNLRFALGRVSAKEHPLIYATCYYTLGELELRKGQLAMAKEYFFRSLRTFENIKDREGIAMVLSYLGTVFEMQGATEEAEIYLRRSIKEAKAIGAVQRIAMVRNNLGNLRLLRWDNQSAMREYLAGVEVARRLGERRLLAISLGNLANVLGRRGEYYRALEHFQETLKLKKELNDPRSLCYTLVALAELEIHLGVLEPAKEKVQEVLQIARNIGATFQEAQALRLLGGLARSGGDQEMMERRFLEAKEIFEKAGSEPGKVEMEMEFVHAEIEKKWDYNAEKKIPHILAYALSKGLKDKEARIYLYKGIIEKSFDVAASYLHLALKGARKCGDIVLEWEVLFRLGRLMRVESREKMNPRMESSANEYLQQSKDILREIVNQIPDDLKESFLSEPLRMQCYNMDLTAHEHEMASENTDAGEGDHTILDPLTSVISLGPYQKLLEINKKLNSVMDIEELLSMIMDSALEITGGQRGFILLKDIDGNMNARFRRSLVPRKLAEEDLEWSQSIAEEVVKTGEPIVTMDASASKEFDASESVHALKLKSILCVPLMMQNVAFGALYLDHPKAKGIFSGQDASILIHFADQASLALDQARMRDELNERLEKTEVTLAGTREELKQIKNQLEQKYFYGKIIGGKDANMRGLFEILEKVKKGSSPVLIHGESGTGKELVARAIHSEGLLGDKPFLTLNCAAVPENLLESELFGHEEGAFTGATQKKRGLFEVADGGTLFLDEIGEMSLPMQAKFLRVLESGEIRKVGGESTKKVNVRLICATHRDLRKMVAENSFRQDLMYRINTITVTVPPLRDRPLDFPLIVNHLMKNLHDRFNREKELSKNSFKILFDYTWPGNIRELSNVLERAFTLSEGSVIEPDDLPLELVQSVQKPSIGSISPDQMDLQTVQKQASKEYLEQALTAASGNVSRAARECGIPRGTFYRLMQRYGVERG